MSSEGAGAALPRWKCHKEVWGDKIVEIADAPDAGFYSKRLKLQSGVSVVVGAEYAGRCPAGRNPLGGYYVRYSDGYESWSPADVFEDGYTRIA